MVTKLQKTYLAPLLLPLECPRLVAYSYFAKEQNLITNGFDIWKNMLQSRNVELYQEQFDEFQDLQIYRKDLLSQVCSKVMDLLEDIEFNFNISWLWTRLLLNENVYLAKIKLFDWWLLPSSFWLSDTDFISKSSFR